jgi:hypothetical protein
MLFLQSISNLPFCFAIDMIFCFVRWLKGKPIRQQQIIQFIPYDLLFPVFIIFIQLTKPIVSFLRSFLLPFIDYKSTIFIQQQKQKTNPF